jgi:hypothetical protein
MGSSFGQEPTIAAPTSLRNGSCMGNDFVLSREGLEESGLPRVTTAAGVGCIALRIACDCDWLA